MSAPVYKTAAELATERTPGSLPFNAFHAACWVTHPESVRVALDPTGKHRVWVGAFTLLDGSGGLTLGLGVEVSSGAQLVTHSSARRCVSERLHAGVDVAPIEIGDHCFIGTHATVLMGCKVGHHSIVGAGVTLDQFTDLPPCSVVRESRPFRASHMLDPDALAAGRVSAKRIDGRWRHPSMTLAEDIADHASALLSSRKAGRLSDEVRSVVAEATRGRSHRELARVWLAASGEVRTWEADAP